MLGKYKDSLLWEITSLITWVALALVWLREWFPFKNTALLTFFVVIAQGVVFWNHHRQTTPSLSPEQAKRWKEIRAKGVRHYVLVPGFIYPMLLMLGVVTIMLLGSDDYLSEKAIVFSIILVGGVTSLFGFLRIGLWHNNEWRYRRSLEVTLTDPDQSFPDTDDLLGLAANQQGIYTENPNLEAE